jgi:hypothetical protein
MRFASAFAGISWVAGAIALAAPAAAREDQFAEAPAAFGA